MLLLDNRLACSINFLPWLDKLIYTHHFCMDTLPCVDSSMITSSNGNIFRVTGHLFGEFTGPRWSPHTKASDVELWCFFICVRINGWVNNRKAGDLRRYRTHYDVSVMFHVYANLCHFGCQEFAHSAIHRRNWKQSNSACSASWPFLMFFASTINA